MYVPHLECTVETIPSEHFSNLMAVLGSKERLYEDNNPHHCNTSLPEMNSSFSESESLSEDFYTDPEYWEPEFKTRARVVSSDSECVVTPRRKVSKGSKRRDDVRLPSVASILDKARSSSSRVISIGTHSLNLEAVCNVSEHVEVFTSHSKDKVSVVKPAVKKADPVITPPAAIKDELPAYLKLFLKPDESPAYIPNTVLLNALLAPSGLHITPIVTPPVHDATPVTSPGHDEYNDNTSHISDMSERSLPSLGYRPPKLQSYTANNTKEASTMTLPVPDIPIITQAVTKDAQTGYNPPNAVTQSKQPAEPIKELPLPPVVDSPFVIPEEEPRSITPEIMYNIPTLDKPSSLLIDTWTCTNPLPEHTQASTETTLRTTEDRAVSPINVYQAPGFTTTTTRKKVTSNEQGEWDDQPRVGLPARVRRTSDSDSDISSVSSLSIVGEDEVVEEEVEKPEPQTETTSRPVSPITDNVTERLPTPPNDPPPPAPTSEPKPRTSSKPSKPKPLPTKKHELQKALLQALIKRPENKTININTLKGIRVQLERQSSELLSARSRLANAGDRMRSKLEMFDVERADESVLEENM